MVDLSEIGAKWPMAMVMTSEWGVCGLVGKVSKTLTRARKNREKRSRNDRDMAMLWYAPMLGETVTRSLLPMNQPVKPGVCGTVWKGSLRRVCSSWNRVDWWRNGGDMAMLRISPSGLRGMVQWW